MQPIKYAHIIQWAIETPWAILPSKLLAIQEALAFIAAGGEYSPAEIQAIVGSRTKVVEKPQPSGIAVLPLRGVIAHRADMLKESSGGISVESFTAQLRELIADPKIGSIVLDVDSPGGVVTGVEELAAEMYEARKIKPIVASVNAMAASAAYWIASAASEISVTPSGLVGSIGVFAAHEDRSALMEKLGVKTSLISAGKYKVENNPFGPLSDEARAYMQQQVNEYYGMFTRAVARGRGVKVADVREGFGEGRMVLAKDALAQGMIDKIETTDETIARLSASREGTVANPSANSEEPEIQAKEEEPKGRSTELERLRLEVLKAR